MHCVFFWKKDFLKSTSLKKCFHFLLKGVCSSFEQMPVFKWLQKLRRCSLNRALCVRLPHLLHYNEYHTMRAKWANQGWRVKSLLPNSSLSQIKLFADFPGPQQWNFRARISNWALVCLYMQHMPHVTAVQPGLPSQTNTQKCNRHVEDKKNFL